jgi:hypothetical protein
MSEIRLPNSKQRLAVIGRTGSGKTVAALWHLSNANFQSMPWVIVDFKTDENINAIEGIRYISTSETPKHPGIYVVQPEPDDPALFGLFDRIWHRGHTGVYIDEGYMVGENKTTEKRFKTLLTQGRSLHIPMIVLSQRPAWISRFVWSESDFFQVFDLSLGDDIETIHRMLPKGSFIPLPDFHSVYYDVVKKRINYLSPVPDAPEIVDKISEQLKPVRKRI